MYELLKDISLRPEPFSRYTAKELWTRPHLARQMLQFHLDQETDLASHSYEAINQIVEWLDSRLGLSGKRLCDLGCGPGLYTQRFADRGAEVCGVDFSENSLEYARLNARENNLTIRYTHADYLSDALPAGFDIVTLIFTGFCVLSPPQRAHLLGRIHKMLKPGGRLILDAAGIGSLAGKKESTLVEHRLMHGFWAEGDYVGIQRSFVYPDQRLSLDRYIIVEPDETWQIFNWFQYFMPDELVVELETAGFVVEDLVGGLTGERLQSDGDLIGIIAGLG